MSAAPRILLGVALLVLAGCGGSQDQAQNEGAAAANAPADVEALPPDESVATSDEELANGADEPQGNELGNSY
jgi:hypothetical protein